MRVSSAVAVARIVSTGGLRLHLRWRRGALTALVLSIGLLVGAVPSAVAAQEPLLWRDDGGQLRPAAKEALGLLSAAADDGLLPEDYAAQTLAHQANTLDRATPEAAAAWDAALTAATLHYLRDLHRGRVDPHALGFRLWPVQPEPDLAARLQAAVARNQVAPLAQALQPPFAEYALLRQALARYRQLAQQVGRGDLPPPSLSRTIKPGDDDAGVAVLAQWLSALGDLPAGTPPPSGRYDGALVDAMQAFQARHGLAADGVVGPTTRRALAVPLADRVSQIEWAMERLRWLAPLEGQRFVAINIPMFRLWAVDASRGAPLSMAVVVGRALDTRTPVLEGSISQVIFRPYWNVPRSILRKEILPRLQRDPGYLKAEDLEIVQGGGDDAIAVSPSAEHLALLREGRLRLRQRPGPRNSLGRVKFVFPNDADVYLHDTPAQTLFGRARRDFSHGCVRVEAPMQLAQWVLAQEPDWSAERIAAAANGAKPSLRVPLRHPVRVLLFYMTAMVTPDDGRVHFVEDVYGHDARLQQALAARRPR